VNAFRYVRLAERILTVCDLLDAVLTIRRALSVRTRRGVAKFQLSACSECESIAASQWEGYSASAFEEPLSCLGRPRWAQFGCVCGSGSST
jgi:hypothetical protein